MSDGATAKLIFLEQANRLPHVTQRMKDRTILGWKTDSKPPNHGRLAAFCLLRFPIRRIHWACLTASLPSLLFPRFNDRPPYTRKSYPHGEPALHGPSPYPYDAPPC